MSKAKGHCACGDVNYSLSERPKFSYLCQCRQCQLATGTGHSALMMIRAESLDVSGYLKFFDQLADSGNIMSRGFCPNCGTPIVLRSSGYPAMLFLTAGSLDNADAFQPSQLLWHSQGRNWDSVSPDLKINAKGV